MSMSSVLIVSIAAGIILVVGGAVILYMANLVRSAYELKVQIAADIEERFARMTDEFDKKSRWIQRNLVEEVEKMKTALETGNARRFQDTVEPLLRRCEEVDALLRRDHAEWVAAIEADREMLARLDARTAVLRRDLKALALKPAGPAEAPPAEGAAAPVAPPPPGIPVAMPPPRPEARAIRDFLPDLGARQ